MNTTISNMVLSKSYKIQNAPSGSNFRTFGRAGPRRRARMVWVGLYDCCVVVCGVYNIQNAPSGSNFRTYTPPPPHAINISPLKYDTVSFGAMKKQEFSRIDLAVVNKFNAPIKELNSEEDFQDWCADKTKEIKHRDYGGGPLKSSRQRREILADWFDYISDENNAYTNSEKLLILGSITEHSPKTYAEPPILHKQILRDTIKEISSSLREDGNANINFNKLYKENLLNHFMSDSEDFNAKTKTGWIKIPSQKNDPENFEENQIKVKVLFPEILPCNFEVIELDERDLHIYMEAGKPKCSAWSDEQTIISFNDKNGDKLPTFHYDKIQKYMDKYNFKTYDRYGFSTHQMLKAEQAIEMADKFKKDLKEDIENNNAKAIFQYMGIEVEENEDGTLTLSHYRPISQYLSEFRCFGVDGNKLFEKVKAIKGDADFRNSDITNLDSLEEISGDAEFYNSSIESLKNLKKVGGELRFAFNPNITNLDSLEEVGGNANFSDSDIDSAKKLRKIGGKGIFGNLKKGISLESLREIGGDASFECSNIDSIKNLRKIGGDLIIHGSNLTKEDFKDIKISGGIY